MENPKEEAMRAREMAIEMMEKKDFKKAQKLALKAHKLCEEVEKMDQILMICDVHCCDEGGEEEKNWYKILKVDPTADEASIKRQYSKMALKLHPDRNSFPGAAQAFNLVLEAKNNLSHHEKRRMYDSRCNAKASSWTRMSTHQSMAKTTTMSTRDRSTAKTTTISARPPPKRGRKRLAKSDQSHEEHLHGGLNDFEQVKSRNSDHEEGEKRLKSSEMQPNSKNLEHMNGEFNDFEQEIMCRQSDDHKKSGGIQPDLKKLEYFDGEFYAFEEERSKKWFSRGQIWAVYDTLDAMPRFYALINDVVSRDFEVKITWLEPLQRNVFENRWLCRGLPASFGKFVVGQSETIRDHGIFSHLVTTWKTSSKSSYVYDISPCKGEIWALFKKWGTKSFMEDVERHEYEFDFVEILSDYYEGFGVNVAFLSRMDGLLSSFCRKPGKGVDWEVIPSNNRLRFSHKIPSFRVQKSVNGVENFFELDPASLPINHC